VAGCGGDSPPPRPTITVDLTDVAAVEGDTATFTVEAEGPGTITYQW
jgi:hypothetical protein